jgi:hypothetical protein
MTSIVSPGMFVSLHVVGYWNEQKGKFKEQENKSKVEVHPNSTTLNCTITSYYSST